MPFYVPVDGGYEEWELQVVDEICNGIECVAGLTNGAKVMMITESYIFDNKSTDEYGCTVFMHEMWHAWHGDWNHEEMTWCGR